jgi:hypothetical protein
MLPEDTKKRKQVEKQPSVTDHFSLEDQDAKPIPYSDKALETAALEWLVQTNQVWLILFIPSAVLRQINIPANSDVQECRIQEDARHCVSSPPRNSTPFAEAVKGTPYRHVQAAVVLIARPPHCM